jgi:hypothetical protein
MDDTGFIGIGLTGLFDDRGEVHGISFMDGEA